MGSQVSSKPCLRGCEGILSPGQPTASFLHHKSGQGPPTSACPGQGPGLSPLPCLGGSAPYSSGRRAVWVPRKPCWHYPHCQETCRTWGSFVPAAWRFFPLAPTSMRPSSRGPEPPNPNCSAHHLFIQPTGDSLLIEYILCAQLLGSSAAQGEAEGPSAWQRLLGTQAQSTCASR